MSKILELRAENVKRLKVVQIKPDGNMVVIGGKNSAGKSSTLDAIMYAIGGRETLPSKPVRAGEEKATIEIDLGDIKVKRTITESGGGSLTVTNAEGMKYGSPQSILDGLVGKLSFDPLEFSRMRPEQQSAQLKALVGLDFKAIESAIKVAYDKRTLVNRDVQSLKNRVAVLPPPKAGLPEKEVSAASILEDQQKAMETNRHNDKARQNFKEYSDQFERDVTEAKSLEADVERLRKELAEAEVACANLNKNIVASRKMVEADRQKVDALKDVDLAPFKTRLAEVESTNAAVRSMASRVELEAQLKVKTKESETLTATIEGEEKKKHESIAGARFPVEGLSVDAEGQVMFSGLPFEQASSAQQLQVSVAIGLALNPKLKVLLIRDGSLLDEDALALLAKMATDADAQVWIERVGSGGEISVIIEDGMVKA